MTKISSLPPDSSPTGDDYTVTVDTTSGQTKKVLLSDIVTYLQTALLYTINPYKFSVYRAGAQNVGTGTTKVQFETENFDTGSNFDAVTNHVFTAPVDGYYQFNANITTTVAGAGTQVGTYFVKNGSTIIAIDNVYAVAGSNPGGAISALVKLVAGDTIEVGVGTAVAAKALDVTLPGYNQFSGFLVSKA